MNRAICQTLIAAICLLPADSLLPAQSGAATSGSATPIPSNDSGKNYKTQTLPQAGEARAPFALGPPSVPSQESIRIIAEAEMLPADHDLVANEEPAIHAAATLAGMEMTIGRWQPEQLVCQSFPDHLFLLYRNDNGSGDASLFSASISRVGSHSVRVIALQRRGYSLYSPAPVNPVVMAEFNQIRAAEPARNQQDWLATGLCYAALTGAIPVSSTSPASKGTASLGLTFPPTLEVDGQGGATVRFVDVAAAPRPMQWALSFTAQGKLVAVEHFPTPEYAVTTVPSSGDQNHSVPAAQ